jgi:hypothetical protein
MPRAASRWLLATAGLLLLGLAGCAMPPLTSASAIPPIAAQQARVWFYRDLNPNDPMATPYTRIDGVVVGSSQQGSAFYQDLAAGPHRIAVDSYVLDGNQFRDVNLGAGQEVFAKIVPFDKFVESSGAVGGGYHRDIFYLWLFPLEAARPAIAQSWFTGGGTLTAAAPPR